MEQHPLVSIITINYNQVEITCQFLESTKKLTYPNYEIIVIDNASVEDPEKKILDTLPEVKLIKSEENLGFAGGNNLGIEQASGELLFIVNNDTEVDGDLLEKLVEVFRKDEMTGMVSPKIKYFDHPDIIQYAGYTEINPFTGRNKTVGGGHKDDGTFDQPGLTAYAHGAAMLVSKKVTDEVGAFPESFFMYYEELDWSARVRKAGYNIYYQADAEILHKESLTIGKDNPVKTYYINRNRIQFMRRNFNSGSYFLFLLFLIFLTIPKNTILFLIKGKTDHLAKFYQGVFWNFHTMGSKDFIRNVFIDGRR